MRTALDAPEDELDDHELKFVQAIREHGFFRTNVLADDKGPGFSFTTGFWVNLGQPELIVFGLDSQTAHNVLWDCYRDLKGGRILPVGERAAEVFGGGVDAWLRPVAAENYPDFLGWSRWFHGGDGFPCLQLFWPDQAGRFPWEDGVADSVRRAQPDLSVAR
jgi:hypothetical protein